MIQYVLCKYYHRPIEYTLYFSSTEELDSSSEGISANSPLLKLPSKHLYEYTRSNQFTYSYAISAMMHITLLTSYSCAGFLNFIGL